MPWLLLSLCFCLVACGAETGAGDPVETFERFLSAMARSGEDPEALAEAFALLDDRTQSLLRARADRAQSLSGRSYRPEGMLVPGSFRLNFERAEGRSVRAEQEGDRAVVHVRGHGGKTAEVPLVRQGGRWRILLSLPEGTAL